MAKFTNGRKGKDLARMHCYYCQNTWDFDPPLARGEECSRCHRDAKVCLNCSFYDSQAHRECREPQASWVKEKDRANFCTYFEPRDESQGGGHSQEEDLKKKLEGLFKS